MDHDISDEPLVYRIDEVDAAEHHDLKMMNEDDEAGVDDLILLPHLHEASILYSLTQRFEMGSIYTFTASSILIALNPFKELPLYSRELLQRYYNVGYMSSQGIAEETLSPHVFAIADGAYRQMMSKIHESKKIGGNVPCASQSILISGESGAGKTESTKFVMKYLTSVGNAEGIQDLEEGSVMDRVLQSNPILEALGNARTIRNDNSSRFGKFIEMMFDKRGNLMGARIETYLLEKVRIPNQSLGERNFHIFYQMAKWATENQDAEEEQNEWSLGDCDEYHFINQGGCYDLRNISDGDGFEQTLRAMTLMGFLPAEKETILNLIASLLHLGQLEFESLADGDKAGVVDGDSVHHVCKLASLPRDKLVRALTEKTLEIGSILEVHTIQLKEQQAYDARDALSKALYGKLFDYVVKMINKSISCPEKDVRSSVGVLDIFGFECFQLNSFEQLCINYTNETLQQQFNQFVFKMEQQEYTKEGIDWDFVEFPDNQDCLDLIESRPSGILSMLDDECRMGIRGTDANFANRLYKTHQDTSRFEASTRQRTAFAFSLFHYAGEVEYSVDTFLDKNKVSA